MNYKTRPVGIYPILLWMVINAIFMVLEVTVFNDASDLNNSVLLILWVISIIGVATMRKVGGAFATFSLAYAFAFNAFNVIYFYPAAALLNVTSAIINAIALAYMFKIIFQDRLK